MANKYEASVEADGTWSVNYSTSYRRWHLTGGKAKTQAAGELAARHAIIEDQAERAKRDAEATMTKHFTVKA